jgi:predicted Zn finger-like uncharacterized protein
MNVQCTSCKTVFRVDPRKVPAGGVRARCSICRAVFAIAALEGAGQAAPARAEAAAPAAAAPAAAAVAPPVEVPAQPAPPAAPRAQAAPAPAPAPPVAAAAPRAPSPFGSSDPAAKAKRLARALISDIVTYFPDRRERALADGTLRKEFTEEITKSWQEYTAQVGAQLAKQTPYFREALNEILAKGQQLF